MPIVKIQRPLGGDLSHLLIYDEGRTFQILVPVDSKNGRFFMNRMGARKKMYCTAAIDKNGKLTIEPDDVGPQDW